MSDIQFSGPSQNPFGCLGLLVIRWDFQSVTLSRPTSEPSHNSTAARAMEESQQPPVRKRQARIATPVWETRQWKQMRHALENRQSIVCFDAEWEYQPPNRVTELGIASWRDGAITVHNVRVRGRGRPFHGGTTIYMTDDAAKAWLSDIMAGADLLVGHALQNDRLKMKQWGCHLPGTETLPVVDTGAWSRLTNKESGNPRRLAHLAAEYASNAKACMSPAMMRSLPCKWPLPWLPRSRDHHLSSSVLKSG